VIYPYILVLIYSGLSIDAQPRADLALCQQEAGKLIGTPAHVTAWDNMNGANPIPKVVIAFCVPGSVDSK
jgi:hypothetical protein